MNHALAAAGREPVPPESLYPLIGPSLADGFSSLLGAGPDSPEVADCIAAYRSVYAEVSLRATPTYPGVPEALAAIARGVRDPAASDAAAAAASGPATSGARLSGPRSLLERSGPRPRLAVATSKPRAFAEPLIAALGFADLFEAIFAPDLDLNVESKTTTVGRALSELGASTGTMVGDRHVDMEAARAHGLRGVGVTWGFGTAEELREAGADVLVASPAELPAAV
jgi:phosphoglycolate phosphatase